MNDHAYDWELWTERLTQRGERSAAVAHLVKSDVHGNLQKNLAQAHVIARHALQILQESDSGRVQQEAARLVYRYADTLADWLTAVLWFSEKAQDTRMSQADRLSYFQKLQNMPTYLPYWDEAQELLLEIFYDIHAANQNTVVATMVKAFFTENGLEFVARPALLNAKTETDAVVAQEPDHEVLCDWCKSPVSFSKRLVGGNGNVSFCSHACAKNYSDKHMSGYDVLNPRNW